MKSLVFLFFPTIAIAQFGDFTIEKLHGKIKVVSELNYSQKDSTGQIDTTYIKLWSASNVRREFNELGKLIKKESYDEINDQYNLESTITYDENDLKLFVFDHPSKGGTKYNYDEHKKIISANYIDSLNNKATDIYYVYNNESRLAEIITYKHNQDTVEYRVSLEYNKFEQIVDRKLYYRFFKQTYIDKLYYSTNGNLIRIDHKSCDLSGKVFETSVTKFDENEMKVYYKSVWNDEHSSEWTYQYKLDNYGNWTERMTLKNGEEFRLSKRRIIYFE